MDGTDPDPQPSGRGDEDHNTEPPPGTSPSAATPGRPPDETEETATSPDASGAPAPDAPDVPARLGNPAADPHPGPLAPPADDGSPTAAIPVTDDAAPRRDDEPTAATDAPPTYPPMPPSAPDLDTDDGGPATDDAPGAAAPGAAAPGDDVFPPVGEGPVFRLPDSRDPDELAWAPPPGDRPGDPGPGGPAPAGGQAAPDGNAGAAPPPVDAPPPLDAPSRPRITPPGGTARLGGATPQPEDDDARHFRSLGNGFSQRPILLLAAVPLLILVALLVGWAVDTAALSGQVVRNVEVAGRPVGGLGEASLPEVIDEIAADTAERPVRITSGDQTYETTAGALGLTVNEEATAEAALDAGRDDALLARPVTWARSFFDAREIAVQYQASEATVALELLALQGGDVTAPVEPTVQLDPESGEYVAVPGQPGSGVDASQVATDLPELAAGATGTIEVVAGDSDVAPHTSDEEAQQVADRANEMTADGLTLRADDTTVQVDMARLRTWVGLAPPPPDQDPAEHTLELAINGEAVNAALPDLFADLATEPTEAQITLEGNQPVVVPGQSGVSCCGENAPDLVWTALQDGSDEVALETQVVEPELTTEDANGLGITQPVGGSRAFRDGAEVPGPAPGYTTYHTPGGARVSNIHRMADIVRGTVVLPGESFSINDVVGERTLEKGFLPAGAISNGEHVDEVGGGVSQFATTMFNAAYFAGYDITTYQAHSEWFSRYPPGREATMGFPNPDLVWQNTSDHGVLVWTSYTGTSLTVTLYSSPYATAEQTDSTETMDGACRIVTTTRTRELVDGGTETDTFRARYRPGDNLDCEGQPINPPEEGEPPPPGGQSRAETQPPPG